MDDIDVKPCSVIPMIKTVFYLYKKTAYPTQENKFY